MKLDPEIEAAIVQDLKDQVARSIICDKYSLAATCVSNIAAKHKIKRYGTRPNSKKNMDGIHKGKSRGNQSGEDLYKYLKNKGII